MSEDEIEELRLELEEVKDACLHIVKVAKLSRTQTRRLRWIAERALSAYLGNSDWQSVDLPRKYKVTRKEAAAHTKARYAIKELDQYKAIAERLAQTAYFSTESESKSDVLADYHKLKEESE